ncbi:unnamed protein product [Ostreobium quekettii]|uniref:Uncharacterized protein n=1 Tax=Ostreobium quekettii TaxID=121088 RepID=A0A8S1J3U8_9CHLO|nr:unnamed protein product [Ostreobium quekettii]
MCGKQNRLASFHSIPYQLHIVHPDRWHAFIQSKVICLPRVVKCTGGHMPHSASRCDHHNRLSQSAAIELQCVGVLYCSKRGKFDAIYVKPKFEAVEEPCEGTMKFVAS